jgi:hypothetical protein
MSASTTPGSSSKPSKHISSKPSKHINVFFSFFLFSFFPLAFPTPITSDHFRSQLDRSNAHARCEL